MSSKVCLKGVSYRLSPTTGRRPCPQKPPLASAKLMLQSPPAAQSTTRLNPSWLPAARFRKSRTASAVKSTALHVQANQPSNRPRSELLYYWPHSNFIQVPFRRLLNSTGHCASNGFSRERSFQTPSSISTAEASEPPVRRCVTSVARATEMVQNRKSRLSGRLGCRSSAKNQGCRAASSTRVLRR